MGTEERLRELREERLIIYVMLENALIVMNWSWFDLPRPDLPEIFQARQYSQLVFHFLV